MKKIKKIHKIALASVRYFYYLIYCRVNKVNNNNVWLISERGNDARDNSYHMFKYIRESYPDVDIKYVISKDSPDYTKVKVLGDVIEFGSKEHYIFMITAGVLISTHVMGFTPDMSLFWRLDKYNLLKLNGKVVFLQHGIIGNYIHTLASNVSKIDLFVSGAKPEFDYLVDTFGHDEGVVKYTGLPRYDKLISNPKKQILIMPTFRKWLNYTDDFEGSEYCKTYNSLLNHKALNDMLVKYNYTVVFYPHYEIQKYISSFNIENKNVVIADFQHFDVQKLLTESDLLITDYSSVFFDFSYMKKPVIYYQFDIDRFRQQHYSEGYFSYDNDGFGPVVANEEQLIRRIQHYFDTSFQVEDKYINRTNRFFVLNDTGNCERVYRAIIELTNV